MASLVGERLGVCPGHPPAPHELGAAAAPAISGFRIGPGMTNVRTAPVYGRLYPSTFP